MFSLLSCPWTYPVKFRLLLAAVFYWNGRYSHQQIVQSIIDSDRIRNTELVGAQWLPNRGDVLRFAVREIENTKGVIAEFGVYQGLSLRILGRAAPGYATQSRP